MPVSALCHGHINEVSKVSFLTLVNSMVVFIFDSIENLRVALYENENLNILMRERILNSQSSDNFSHVIKRISFFMNFRICELGQF